ESELPTLEKPWTWDEFNTIAKKLKDHYNKPAIDFRINSNDEMLPYAYMPLIWSNNGSVVNEDGTKAEGYFNSKESVEAVQFIQNLVKEGYTTVSPVEKGFETGEYPMLLSGSWTIADMNTNYKDIDFGILPYPVSS
ncbi:ABC transporter substrate-binding protein, partial [Streptococcus pneumoniae]